MPDLQDIKDELWSIIKESASDLFDKEADLEALAPIIADMAEQRLQLLTGTPAEQEDARANLQTWGNVIKLKVAQKALKVKKGADSILEKIIGVAGKLLASALFPV